MNKKLVIPQPVVAEARFFIERFGNKLLYAGRAKGRDFFSFAFPDDMEVGAPLIIEYNGGKARQIEGKELFEIMHLLGVE